MKKSMFCLLGLGIALVCLTQLASAQTFIANESGYSVMKVAPHGEQGKTWKQVTHEVRNPHHGHYGYNPRRPAHGHHHQQHVAPPRPPRHHYSPVVVPAPHIYVPVVPVHPHHGHHYQDHYHGHHHHGFSIQIGGPYGGFYFRN